MPLEAPAALELVAPEALPDGVPVGTPTPACPLSVGSLPQAMAVTHVREQSNLARCADRCEDVSSTERPCFISTATLLPRERFAHSPASMPNPTDQVTPEK